MQIQAKILGIVLCALAAAACDDGGGGISGVVYSWEETPPDMPITVAGVTVGVFGEPQISDTTDANGRFTLENVPNGDVFFTTMKNGYWGLVDYYYVPDQTAGRDISLNVVMDAEIARWQGELGRPIPATMGAVDILYFEGAVGGETGAIMPPAGDLPFTFDGWTPMNQTSVIADDTGFGELVFPSVDPANATIRPTVTGSPDQTSCVVDETPGIEYPIMEKHLTIVYAYCEPL